MKKFLVEELSFRKKVNVAVRIYKNQILELVRFDSKICSLWLLAFYLTEYWLVRTTKGPFKALVVAAKIFRHTQFRRARRFATGILQKMIKKHGMQKVARESLDIVFGDINNDKRARLIESVRNDAFRPFDKRLIILSPPYGNKKGVILVKFSEYFKYLASIFDLSRLSKDYLIVVEPSSIGLFDLDLLCLMSQDLAVIVETQEPVDAKFLNDLAINLYPVDVGSNCWVDWRTFHPMKNVSEKYEVVMVAIFADVKRHYHLFRAMKKSKVKVKVALVGVEWPKKIEDIQDEARFFGVFDQVTFFQNMSQADVNVILNNSKCFLLLSKKEGSNKASIESMFAGTPVFYLQGYNYGYDYPFINHRTGGFIEPQKLSQFLESIDVLIAKSGFSPHDWVIRELSPQASTKKLASKLEEIEARSLIKVNKELAVKINNPDCDYLDSSYWLRYKRYYIELKSYLKQSGSKTRG